MPACGWWRSNSFLAWAGGLKIMPGAQPDKPRLPANVSLQKKSAARVAAVQCLYTQSFHDKPLTVVRQVEILKMRLHNKPKEQKLVVGKAIEPNYKLVETLLTGITDNEEEIRHRMEGALSHEWKRERMSPVLIAILQCAIYELFFGKEIHTGVVLDEYTKLTRSFFSHSEADFMYGALSSLIQQYG